MKKRLLCVLMKNNHVYEIGDDNIFIQDKNCYIITKYGSMAHPVICYNRVVGGNVIDKNKVIGGYTELIEFLIDKSNDKVYLRGFSRAVIGRILRLVLEKQSSEIAERNVEEDGNKITKSNLEQPSINLGSMGLSQECIVAANYIIEEINKYNEGKLYSERIIMTVKRLQKLLYFCDVEYMLEHDGTPMFSDVFHAWPSGPVISEVYDVYMQYQDGNIRPMYDSISITITEEIKSVVDRVLDEKKELDTVDMIELCNVAGGPWAQVFDAEDKRHMQIISKEEMYKYYSNATISNSKRRLKKK